MNLKSALAYSKLRHQALNHQRRTIPSRAAVKRASFIVRKDRRENDPRQRNSMLHASNNHPKPFTSLPYYTPESVRMKLAAAANARIRRAIERASR